MKVTTKGKVNRVYGGLLGQHTGTKCEVVAAFEFVNRCEDDTQIDLDFSYIDLRREMAMQVFPKLDIVGFFSTNSTIHPAGDDTKILMAMEYFGVVTPIYLVLSTDLSQAEELPVATYESNKINEQFKRINCIVEGCDSERICLETVTKANDLQTDESAMIQNMLTIKNAVQVLKSNLNLIKSNLNNPKLQNEPKFISLLDELTKNYPNVNDINYKELLKEKEQEILILNNICSSSVNVSLQGRLESVSEERRLFK